MHLAANLDILVRNFGKAIVRKFLDTFHQTGKGFSDEDAQDGRRSLVPAQTVHIVQRCHRAHKQMVVLIYASEDAREETQELKIGPRVLTWFEKIDSGICHKAPVAVFSATVNPVERFLVENHPEVMFLRDSLHYDHHHQILV